MKVREKKRFYHKFLDGKTPANWQFYKNANWKAKKAVAVTRANHYENLYDKLDTGHWMARAICIDLLKAVTNVHRISNTSVALITRTVLCLPTVEPQRIDGENTSSRFQLKNLLILHFHNHYPQLDQFHLSAQLVLRGGGEEDGAATLSTKPKPSGRGEPPCGGTGIRCNYFGLPAVIQ